MGGLKIKFPKFKDVARGVVGVGTGGLSELLYYQPMDMAKKQANAAQQAAEAQLAEGRRVADEARQYRNQAIEYAQSPQELAALEQSLKVQEQHIQRQMKFVQAIDPAVLESSQQVLKLLKGEEASTLGPLRNQRQTMRDNLLSTLRAQLGPGAETSSIGQNALQKFDMETNQLMSGAQSQTLNQLMGIAGAGSQLGDLQGAAMGNAQIAGAFGNRSARIANTALGGSSSIIQAGLGNVGNAGAPWVGQQLQAQANRQTLNSLVGLGAQVGGMFATGGLSGAFSSKPAPKTSGTFDAPHNGPELGW